MNNPVFCLVMHLVLLASVPGCATREQYPTTAENQVISMQNRGNGLVSLDFDVEKVEFVPNDGDVISLEGDAELKAMINALGTASLVTNDVSPRYTHKLRLFSNDLDETRILRFDMVNGYAQVASAHKTRIYQVKTIAEIQKIVDK